MVFKTATSESQRLKVGIVIPALNEEASIYLVVSELLSLQDSDGKAVIDEVVVADNGSEDNTAQFAFAAGAKVIYEPLTGYGYACLSAISVLNGVDIIIFMDADYAFFADDLPQLLLPFSTGADLVLGSRTLGNAVKGSLTTQQRLGNRLAVFLIKYLWGYQYTDLGPFRAIRSQVFETLNMQELTYGWTVEMQIKAILADYHVCEVPVKTRVRLGKSKVSGTVKGSVGAGIGILSTIAKLWWRQNTSTSSLKNNKTCF